MANPYIQSLQSSSGQTGTSVLPQNSNPYIGSLQSPVSVPVTSSPTPSQEGFKLNNFISKAGETVKGIENNIISTIKGLNFSIKPPSVDFSAPITDIKRQTQANQRGDKLAQIIGSVPPTIIDFTRGFLGEAGAKLQGETGGQNFAARPEVAYKPVNKAQSLGVLGYQMLSDVVGQQGAGLNQAFDTAGTTLAASLATSSKINFIRSTLQDFTGKEMASVMNRLKPLQITLQDLKDVTQGKGTPDQIERFTQFNILKTKGLSVQTILDAAQSNRTSLKTKVYDFLKNSVETITNNLKSSVSPEEQKLLTAETKKGVENVISEGEHTSQEIVGTIIKNGLEKTPEGKQIMKIALDAQNRGHNIVVESPKIASTTKAIINSKEESVIKPSTAVKPEEIASEIKKAEVPSSSLKFNSFKTTFEEEAGEGRQLAYQRPFIGRTELKTLIENRPDFKANPVLTVDKDKNLIFTGGKTKLKIKPEALQINPDKLVAGTKIRVDVKALTGTRAQQLRVSNSSGVYASGKNYSDIKSAQKSVENIKSVAFPELLRIARSLNGNIPTLKKFKGQGGEFYKGTGKIRLDPEIFKDPILATKVFAHELGHLSDFLPDRTLARGNLLGRIASLRKYMRTMLEEFPGEGGGLITAKERAKLRARAKVMAETNFETVTREIETGTEPTNPEDVLSIWNSSTAGIKNPELLSYIQSLSDSKKVELVKGAMRGDLPQWVNFVKSVKETITEKVLRNSPEDIRKLYDKMLQDEIIARRLFDLKTIKKELQILSRKWQPYNPNLESAAYNKYRSSSVELYADAISVLFNDPALLKQEAPTFWKAYFNYLDNKPEVKENFEKMWELLNQGDEAVFKARDEALSKSFESGEQAFTARYLDQQKRQTSLMYQVKLLFDDVNTPIKEKMRLLQKEGKDLPANLNPDYALKGLLYSDGELKNYISDNFQPVFAKAQEVPDGWNNLGKITFFERVINERGELANPQGYSPKEAAEQLAMMEKNISPADWQKLQEAKERLRGAVQKSLDFAEKNQYYTPDLLAQMKANPAYATFQVVDYLDTYITPRVYQQKGTLKDIANPATSTVMKLINLHKAIKRNNAKKLNIEFLKDNFNQDIEVAKTKWNGRSMDIKPPKDPATGLVITIEHGKPQGYYVEKDISDMLNHTSNTTIEAAARISRVISQSRFYRPLFTVYNLGFQTFNFVRDLRREWRNYPHSTLAEIPLSPLFDTFKVGKGYAKAVLPSARRVLDKPDALIKEMENANILGLTYNDIYSGEVDPEAKQIERIFERSGISIKEKKRTLFTPFTTVLDKVATAGDFIETLPKVAGYIQLKGTMPEEELAEFVRTSIGSPAFRVQGQATPVLNNIFMFSNAIKEGIKSDIQVAKGQKGRATAAGFWYKTVFSDFLPKFVMAAVAAGYFGDKLKKQMDKVSEYDKTNYTILPLGEDKNGQAVYLRIPHDETGRFLSGLLWKAININKDKASLQDLFDIFSFGAGQFPNLSPSFTGVGALISYLSGNNPYDSFRSKNIIPDTEFKAGFKYSFPIFLNWLVKNQGLGIIAPMYSPNNPTDLQKLLNAPGLANILGRWVKTSSYGDTERLKAVAGEAQQQTAERLLGEREKVDAAIKAYQKDPGQKTQIENQLIKDIGGDKAKQTNTLKKFRIGIVRGENNPQINSLIDANTNAEKTAILQELKNSLSDTEFKDVLKTARDNKIIGDSVFKSGREMQKTKPISFGLDDFLSEINPFNPKTASAAEAQNKKLAFDITNNGDGTVTIDYGHGAKSTIADNKDMIKARRQAVEQYNASLNKPKASPPVQTQVKQTLGQRKAVFPKKTEYQEAIKDYIPPSEQEIKDYIAKKFPENSKLAIAIFKQESQLGLYPQNNGGYPAFGVGQVALPYHRDKIPGKTDQEKAKWLLDYKQNIDLARKIYDEKKSFTPWQAYTSGEYRKYLEK